ncbi:hypothetical protein SAMN05216559_0150 [Halomicrobium zhouii]|uniref:DUF7577 domain-containing protein n=1 Tax=Halomicrobium zhouii TaxID=767519 RepID=A0A1I6K506_9EURY|nr:hypothetical protein [Halomicrobium zhouii]SFR85910.1 hypothetical protein SAMN05216559_0150 [Halomicrobium zhouii]
MAIGQFELAFRVLAGLFVVVAPTLLFLGLWKGLTYLRDDELIERARRMDGRSSPSPDPTGISAFPSSAFDASEGVEVVVCDACGTANRAGVTFCRECFGRLPDD